MNALDTKTAQVGHVMTPKPYTVSENTSMKHVDELLKTHGIHHMLVVDKSDQLLGIISKEDIQLLKDWGTSLGLSYSIHKNQEILESQLAGERMTPNPVTITPQDTLQRCAELFRENYFHALPVVEDKKVVGIITTYDLINFAYF